MLSRFLSPHVTGQYDFSAIPLSLPTPLVLALLASSSSPLEPSSAPRHAATRPNESWVVLELGQQINTGVGGVPGGKSTFWEAKLEIPFLSHPAATSTALVTLKHTLLFSAAMMTFSGRHLTGLRTHTATFAVEGSAYRVGGWMHVDEVDGEPVQGWDEASTREVLEGWWMGERSADATRFHLTPKTAARRRPNLLVRIHLPSFLAKSLAETHALFSSLEQKMGMDDEGWLELRASGWAFSETTAMETRDVKAL